MQTGRDHSRQGQRATQEACAAFPRPERDQGTLRPGRKGLEEFWSSLRTLSIQVGAGCQQAFWSHAKAKSATSSVVVVRSRLSKIMVWSRTHQGRKLIRFTSGSVVSTAVSAVVISLVYGLKIIKGEVDATLFGNLVAAIPSYQLNRQWTWGKSGRSHLRKEVLPFACMTALGIGF